MPVLSTLSERERDLRINRTIHWLRQGVHADQLDPARIDVAPGDIPSLVHLARSRMEENDRAYANTTRMGALGYMAFGSAMLLLAYYLASGDVPLLRQGRLLLVGLMGAASFLWGLFRFFNHNPEFEF